MGGTAGKRRKSSSPGRVPGTPVTQKSSGGTSRTPATKPSTSSPGRVVSGLAGRRPQSASPGRVPGTPASQKNSGGTSQTPSTKPSTSSPGRVVSGSAAAGRRLQSASPGRVPGTPASQKNSGGTLQTPATKQSTSTSPGRVVSGSAARRPQSASPGRVSGTPASQKNSGGALRTPSTASKAVVPASPGHVMTGSAAKRRQSASSRGVTGTRDTQMAASCASETPVTKPSTSASPGRVAEGPSTKRRNSTSPSRDAKTPVAQASRAVPASRTPTTKPSTPSSVPSGSVVKRLQSASPGRVQTASASPSRVPSKLGTKQDLESPGHVMDIPVIQKRTPATKPTTSPGRMVQGSSVTRCPPASPGRGISGSATKHTPGTPTKKPTPSASPGRVVSGAVTKRQKSASPGSVPNAPGTQKSTTSASQTPATKATSSASPGLAVSGSVTKHQKSASPGVCVPGTPGTQKSTAGTLKTPATKPTSSASPGRVVIGSLTKRQKPASPGRVPGTPASSGHVGSVTKCQKSASPGHIPSTSPASPGRVGSLTKRQKSTTPGHIPSSPASPGHVGSVTKRPKSASPKRVSGTPETLATPATKVTASAGPGSVVNGSPAKCRKSASPGRTPVTRKSTSRRGSQTPVNRRNTPAKPSPRPSGVSASPERVVTTAASETGAIQTTSSPDQRPKSSATKRRKSASAGHAATSETETGPASTSPRWSEQAVKSAAKRRSANPVHTASTPMTQKSILSPKSGTPKSAKRGAASPLSSSRKLSTKRAVKRSGSPLEEPPHKHFGVSFGPDMSPELFDQRLPPITPVRRGATPKHFSAVADVLKPLLKGRHSTVGTTVAEETEDAGASVDSAKATKSAKRRSEPAERSPAKSKSDVNAAARSVVKPVMKSRPSSARTPAAEGKKDEVSPGQTLKFTKRRSRSAERGSEILDMGSKRKASKSGNKRSKSLSAVDDEELEVESVTKKKRSRSMIRSKEAMAGGDNLVSETSKKSRVKAADHDRSTTASPDRVKRTPSKPFWYRSPTLQTGSIKVKGSKMIAEPSPKRARSLSPVKVLVVRHDQPTLSSPDRGKRTPQKPFRYRSPTLETGSIKAKGSKKIAVPLPERARSLSPISSVPSTKTGESSDSRIGKKGKTAAAGVVSSPTSFMPGMSVQIMHSPSAVRKVELTPTTLSGSKPKSAVAMRSKGMMTPDSAKKRKSLTASGLKGNKSPLSSSKKVISQGVTTPESARKRKSLTATGQKGMRSPLSLTKKVISPRLDLGEITSSPASGKKQKSGGKKLTLDSVEKSSESTISAKVMTPGRMVAMRAVFGREMTPKLTMPRSEVPSKSSPSVIKMSARKSEKEVVKPGMSQTSSAKQSAAKVLSSKKSARKSTAKKALWSEVVRRTTATQKSGPKIVKPIIVKAQKTKAAAASIVSIVSCCYLCWSLPFACFC